MEVIFSCWLQKSVDAGVGWCCVRLYMDEKISMIYEVLGGNSNNMNRDRDNLGIG